MKSIKMAGIAALTTILAGAPALAQKSKDTLRFPMSDPDAGIDTYTLPSSFNNIWTPAVYDMLLDYDSAKGHLVGHLAKSFKQVDATTTEFDLQTGVKWHDGQDFDADDVVHTLNYLIDPKVKLRFPAYWSWMKSIEKLGTHKVRVTSKQPVADGLMYLASRTPIYPEHLHSKFENKLDFAARPVGTGPLRAVQIDKNTGIVAERYANYMPTSIKPKSGVGRVVSEPIKDMGTLTATLLTGQADIVADLSPDQAQDLKSSGRFDVTVVTKLGYAFIGFPTAGWQTVKALSDVRVRRAIAMAINRDELVKIKLGAFTPQHDRRQDALCVKEQLGCGYTKTLPAYDPAGAKKLLAEAGYAEGFDVVISTFAANMPDATAMAGMLRAVGIRASVRQHPTAQRVQLIKQGKVEIGYYGWSGGGMMDVSGEIGRHVDSEEYADPTLVKLATGVDAIMDDAERRKAVTKVFDHITENAYGFPMIPSFSFLTHTTEVKLNMGPGMKAGNISPAEFGWK